MNCKTESHFFIMFSIVGRIWICDGPRVENQLVKLRHLSSFYKNAFEENATHCKTFLCKFTVAPKSI